MNWDLFVTIVEEHPGLRDDIRAFKPSSDVRMVENKGYDVWPFLSVLQDVGVDQYDYILKLHTKRDMPYGAAVGRHHMERGRWRKCAYSLLRSKENFETCLKALEKDLSLGMCADYRLIIERECVDPDPIAVKSAKEFLAQMSLDGQNFSFVAGTMFLVRASLFSPLMARGFVEDDFLPSSHRKKTSLAHTIERVFGIMVLAQGQKIKDVHTPLSERYLNMTVLVFILMAIRRFLWRKKITKNGHCIIKVLKIPVYVGSKKYHDS